jgi:multiple sugar transport system permease protein
MRRAFAPSKLRSPWVVRRVIESLLFYLAVAVGLLLSIFPVFWVVLTSFRPMVDIFRFRPQWIPQTLNLDNYAAVFRSIALTDYLLNTLIVSLSVTFVCLLIGSLAGYALARFRFRGSNLVQSIFLVGRMLPYITALVPLFLIVAALRLLDTYFALIAIHVAFKLPITIWLMQAYVSTIPVELEEAAKLDGCSVFQVLTRITGPLIVPGFAGAGIIAFLFTWNDLLIALVIASTRRTQPMAVGLTNFFLEHGIDWGPMSAAAVIMLLPALAFAFFAQRYLIQGLTAGGMKG